MITKEKGLTYDELVNNIKSNKKNI